MGWEGFKNPALSPLFVVMTGGMIFVAAYCIRSLTRNADVSWTKEQTPQNMWKGKQFKMFNPRGIDHTEQSEKVPEY